MELRELLSDVKKFEIHGNQDVGVRSLHLDSREIKSEALFAALTGTRVDGHKFIDKAIEKGAVCILCEKLPEEVVPNITYIVVSDSAKAIGQMAHVFYGRPSEHLLLVGITGTNGKSTVGTLLYQLIKDTGKKAGLLSTISYRIGDLELPATHTTPDAITIHRLLAEMVKASCSHVFMEVSSHAVDQQRIAGLNFSGGVFTNLSHDHLDYHKTFKAYIKAKKKFFDELGAQAFALTNIDDRNGMIMVQNTKAKVSKFSLQKVADYKARIIENSISGILLELNGVAVHSRLIGQFNAYNICAVYGVAIELGLEAEEVLLAISNLKPAKGRFEVITGNQQKVYGVVDYAHTPDALQNVLSTLLQLRKKGQRVIVIAGCGGDRDRTKRPKMAQVVAANADVAIFTSDNPRSEEPQSIIDEMMEGLDKEEAKNVLEIVDRKQAIRTAVKMAKEGDLILLAGKGHEKYQEIKGEKFPFDDISILKEELKDI